MPVFTYRIIPIRQFPNFISNEELAKEFKHFQYTLENYPPKGCNNYTPTYGVQDGICVIWKCLSKIIAFEKHLKAIVLVTVFFNYRK